MPETSPLPGRVISTSLVAVATGTGSRAQTGSVPPLATSVSAPPVHGMTRTPSPAAKAICVPSGDHAGKPLGEDAGSSLRSLPAESIEKIARWPPRGAAENASRDPSGRHAASASSIVCVVVSRLGALPSGAICQMSKLPALSLSYAIFVPSGDQSGCCSMVGSNVSRRSPVPSASMT